MVLSEEVWRKGEPRQEARREGWRWGEGAGEGRLIRLVVEVRRGVFSRAGSMLELGGVLWQGQVESVKVMLMETNLGRLGSRRKVEVSQVYKPCLRTALNVSISIVSFSSATWHGERLIMKIDFVGAICS